MKVKLVIQGKEINWIDTDKTKEGKVFGISDCLNKGEMLYKGKKVNEIDLLTDEDYLNLK